MFSRLRIGPVNPMLVGIDIGGTKIELAAFDAGLNTLCKWREPTPTASYKELVGKVSALVEQASELVGPPESVGVGVPGVINDGHVWATSNVPSLQGQDLRTDLSSAIGRRVVLANDATSFVRSEAFDGSGRGYSSVCGLVIGTGYAGAFASSGSVILGRQGVAGEIGHVPISAVVAKTHGLPLRRCGCGLAGCIEQYVSGPGLDWICRHFGSPFNSAIELAKGLQNATEDVERVLTVYLDCLGSSIAGLVLTHDPDVFVLGGGVTNMKCLFERLPSFVQAHLFAGVTCSPIRMARHGDSSGVRGAALIGRQE